MLGYVVLLFSLPNYAASIGLTAQQGSVVGAMMNLGQGVFVVSQILVLTDSDRYGATFCGIFQRCSRST